MLRLELPWLQATLDRVPSALPAALLLSGQKGLGKGALALALAQSRLCEGKATPGAGCGTCPSCHLFVSGNHPDFRLLRPEAQTDEAQGEDEPTATAKKPSLYIRIEAVRAVSELAGMTSHRGGARVVVIAPAESLYPSAANALLKILEEPPPLMHFLLVSHEPHRLPKTILSRCLRVAVVAPTLGSARDWLQERAGERSELALAMGAYAPLSAADLAQNDEYWISRRAFMDEFWREDGDPMTMAQYAEPLEPAALASMLQMCCHDILTARHGIQVRYHRDYAAKIRKRSLLWAPQAVAKWHDEILRFARSAYHPLNRRLALEALFAALPVA